MNAVPSRFRFALLSGTALSALAACQGGSTDDGIAVGFTSQAAGTPRVAASGEPVDATVFRRDDGLLIDLERGLVVVSAVALEPCPSVAAAAMSVLTALNPIGTAHAHGGDGDTPAGSVSVLGSDPTVAELGDLEVAPGRYCGVTVEIAPGKADPATAGQPTDMANTLVSVAPCFYPSTVGVGDDTAAAATDRQCTEAKITGGARRITLPLSTPLEVGADARSAAVSVRVRHETWFDGIDLATLATDAAAQAQLLDNVAASLVAVSEADQLVSVAFSNRINGSAAECGKTYADVGAAGSSYQLADFKYYVTDLQLRNGSASVPVSLINPGDGTVLNAAGHTVALMGMLNGCAGTADARREARLLQGTVPAGNYSQLCFTLGVPPALNHMDPATAPSPLNNTPMLWSWLGGRKFIRVDGAGLAGDTRTNFFLHLGSTGCTNATGSPSAPPDSACTNRNLPEICVDYADVVARGALVFDAGTVFEDVDTTVNTEGTAPGCMSGGNDPECITVFPKLGLNFSFAGAQYPAEAQQLVTVVPNPTLTAN